MSLRALQGPTGGGTPVGGTGTTNYIPRWNPGPSTLGDSGLVDDSTSIYTSTRRVGVDTSTTLANVKLQVGTAASLANYQGAPLGVVLPAGSGSWLELAENSASGTSFRISKDSSTGVVLNTNGKTIGFTAAGYTTAISSSQVVLTTTGNFGIGTTPNAWATSVRATEMRTHAWWNYNSGSDSVAYWTVNAFLNSAGNAIYKATAAASQYTQIGGAHVWERAVSGTAGNTVTWLESARIDSAGNFAVGRVPTAGTIFETQGDQVTFRDAAGNVRFRFEAANSLVNVSIGAGWGLKLPATPGNADTQTLDAYQEIGTGTPAEIALTLTCGTSGTITVNAASSKARVTRVGNKVIGHGRIVVSSVSAPLGRLSCVLTGCPQPFTNFLVETQTDNTTGLASGNRIVGTSDTAATPTIYFDRYSPNTSSTDAAANIQAGTIIVFNICYSV